MHPLRTPALLVRSCHPAPAVAVTVIAAALATSVQVDPVKIIWLTLAVLAGQLVIGWSNDLIDLPRDRAVGRTDKPLASGELEPGMVRGGLAVAGLSCLTLSLLTGPLPGVVHLLLVVGSGLAYNLWLKASIASFVPYAVAFGTLPAVATLALEPPRIAPIWMLLTGALLGIGAHLVNALPDLAADRSTAVLGLPQRLGARWCRWAAAVLLTAGSAVAVLGPPAPVPAWTWVGAALVAGLALLTVTAPGHVPFRAALGIALLDVTMLVLRAATAS